MRGTGRPARVLAAAAAAVLVAGVLAVVSRPGDRPRPTAAPAPAPAAPRAEDTSPTPRPSPTAHPGGPRPGGPAARADAPRPGATPRPSSGTPDPGGPWRDWWEPDGEPGYGDGFTGCAPATAPQASDPPPGVTFELRPIVDEVVPGARIHAFVVVANHGRARVTSNIRFGQTAAFLVDSAGRARSAIFWSDSYRGADQELDPGESAAFPVVGTSVECGDTPSDDHPALPEGEYELVAEGSWSSGEGSGGGDWATTPARVRLAAGAEPTPCAAEETHCDIEPKYREDDTCGTAERPGGDYGTGRGLAIAVDLDTATVRAGARVTGHVVVTNTGSEPHWLMPTDPLGDGVVRSAGGLLGEGAGPHGLGPRLGGARGPSPHQRSLWTPDQVRRLGPGESLRVAVTLVTAGCDGTPLPEGSYRARTGVYLTHWGWWPAPEATVTLTT